MANRYNPTQNKVKRIHPPMSATILIVDDDENVRLSLEFLLEEQGYNTLEADSPTQAAILLESQSVDLMLLDMNYAKDTTGGEEGLEFLNQLQQQNNQVPVIAMTAWASVNVVVPAMQNGASDFIEKPWDNNRLLQVIKQQLAMASLKQKNRQLQQNQRNDSTSGSFQWRSAVMQNLERQIERVANADAGVLLTGENGTGKSTIAGRIHQMSDRSEENLVVVNMGAIPSELFESEMFGHKRGAFTGANENRIGRFELADGGSLFLDEIAAIPQAQQAKLLRVLETGEFEQVGCSKTRRANVRMISASNADFERLIQDNQFRQDLYFRLNTIMLHVPPLRERSEDIIALAHHFLRQYGQKYRRNPLTISAAAQRVLQQYHWPGNVRECSHVMERAALLSPSDEITEQDLNLSVSATSDAVDTTQSTTMPMMTLEEGERMLILQALEQSDNNTQNAATLLGITPSALYRRIDKYQIKMTRSKPTGEA